MTGRPRGRPRLEQTPSSSEETSSVGSNSSLTSLSPPGASSNSVSSFASVSTVVQSSASLADDHVQQLDPLPQTPPHAKPDPTPLQQIKQLAEEAKANDVDPTMLLFAQLLSKHTQPQPTVPLVRTEPLSKSVGELKQGEDIFVFLHRFEYQMKLKAVPPDDWLHVLPSLLHGEYSEAYYNNISSSTTFCDMRTVLLNTGGYSLTDCLNSFPLKFRANSSKSLIQWFNHWRYKFGVIIEHFSFLSGYSDTDIESVSQVLATIGILAGMSTDSRESVLNRGHTSNLAFVQDCSTMCSNSDQSQKPRQSHSHPYSNSHSGNYGNHFVNRSANVHSGNGHNHHNSHYRPHSNSHSSQFNHCGNTHPPEQARGAP